MASSHDPSSSSTHQAAATDLDSESDALPSPVNPNLVVSKDVRSFRTISTMLEHLQTKEMEKIADVKLNTNTPEGKELQLYSAFATVTVIDLDVVTVGSNAQFLVIQGHPQVENPAPESPESTRHQGTNSPSALNLVLAPEGERHSAPIESQPASDSGSYISYALQALAHPLVFVNNYLRRDAADDNPVNTGPELRETRQPNQVASSSDEDAIKFLDAYP